MDKVRTLRKYGPHDPAGNPPSTLTVKCAGSFPLCKDRATHPRAGSHEVVLQVPPGTLLLREQVNTLAWIATNPEDDMAKKAAYEEQTYLSGFCNPGNPLSAHEWCLGAWKHRVCRCDKAGCACNNRRLAAVEAATGIAAATTPAPTSWTAEEVMDLMVELDTCPLCTAAWDAHTFNDDDSVSCP